MSSLNKAQIIGNLGRDPEIRHSPSGTAVANINVATSEKWKDKESGQQQEKTEWHRIVAFGRTAEIMGQYLKKGSKVYIEGKLQTRKWQDKEGNDRYTTEIVTDRMLMLGSEPQSAAKEGGAGGDEKPEFDDSIPFAWVVAIPLISFMVSLDAAQTVLQA